MSLGDLPSVLLVSCGGTISSIKETTGGAAPTLGGVELADRLSEINTVATIETFTYSTVASSDLHLQDALSILEILEERRRHNPSIAGFVVSQGTDTMEEMAFAVDLLWSHDTPVVFTGAMRNGSLPSADGPANLMAAIQVAVSSEARGCGVLLVFDDEIHAAQHVRKSHTSSTSTFRSSSVGPIGFVVEGDVRVLLRPVRALSLTPPTVALASVPVALVTASIGETPRLLEGLTDRGYAGVVVEALGGGHLPSSIAESDELARLVDAVPVLLASRTGAGGVLRRTYEFRGSELDLLRRRLVATGWLDGPKSRVLLSLLLAGGADRPRILQTFASFGGGDDAA